MSPAYQRWLICHVAMSVGAGMIALGGLVAAAGVVLSILQ
jgi:hypothetical protein